MSTTDARRAELLKAIARAKLHGQSGFVAYHEAQLRALDTTPEQTDPKA